MTAPTFDTYKPVRALAEAGFEEAQAEAAIAVVGAAKAHVAAEVASLRADMYRLVPVTAVGIVGLTDALVKLLAQITAEILRHPVARIGSCRIGMHGRRSREGSRSGGPHSSRTPEVDAVRP